MNYEHIYESLITKARARNLTKKTADFYTEEHHIIPRCVGGDDSSSNLVVMTPEEHLLAHLLLCKIMPDNPKIIHAAAMMTGNRPGKKAVNLKKHGWARRKHAAILSARVVSDETREKLRSVFKNKPIEEQNQIRERSRKAQLGKRHSAETIEKLKADGRRGRRHSEETKRKISEAGMGRKHTEEAKQKMRKPKSDEAKANISNGKLGHTVTEETKKKISEKCKGYKHTPEALKKISEASKLRHAKRRKLQNEQNE
jgi:hypothetical protein